MREEKKCEYNNIMFSYRKHDRYFMSKISNSYHIAFSILNFHFSLSFFFVILFPQLKSSFIVLYYFVWPTYCTHLFCSSIFSPYNFFYCFLFYFENPDRMEFRMNIFRYLLIYHWFCYLVCRNSTRNC